MTATKLDGPHLDGKGVAAAVGAYAMWGLFPAFWPLLAPAVPIEVLAHRIAWTVVLMTVVLSLRHGWPELRALPRRGWGMVTAAAVLITVNWGLYIFAVFDGQFVEAALGYFVSPLVSVLLGVAVLHERLRRLQWAAVALAGVAVVVIAVENGRPPWIALALATSFGTYGLIKRTVPLSATASVTAEGLVLGPLAVAVVVWFQAVGGGTMIDHGTGHLLLLIAAGPVTAIPLLLYGVAARRVPLSTIGVLMYLNPILQFSWGVFVVHEAMPATRWIGFVLVWVALAVFTMDLIRTSRPAREPGRRQPVAVDDVGGERGQGVGSGAGRELVQLGAGGGRLAGEDIAGAAQAVAGAEQGQGLVDLGVVGDGPGEQQAQAIGVRAGLLQRVEHRQGVDALPQVRAGRLAGAVGRRGDVDDVVGDLERGADHGAEALQRIDVLGRAAGEQAAVTAGRRDQRAGLLRDHGEVVRHRVLAVGRSAGLPHLARDQLGKGLGDDPYGVRAEVGHQSGGVREQEVPGEDRDGVVHREFALSAPRRIVAESITSSW